ncbi:protocadherin Fat 4-like [Esox lucius]|uniref:protocadherin Fat 4-like n=1 Tax=Esox lucius TaxID=8010 RepID=UPI001476F43C|nr:protocadherin Fat 4-like [Esox lucius]
MDASGGSWIKYKAFHLHLMVNTICFYGMPLSSFADVSKAFNGQVKWSNLTVVKQHPFSSWYQISDGPDNDKLGATQSPYRWLTALSFSRPVYSFQVREDTQPGMVVGKLEAEGPRKRLTDAIFSVLEDDGEGLFLLSPVSGDFLLSRSMDYETQRLYILTVVMMHRHSRVSSVRVYFNVLDVNDNRPVFGLDNYFINVAEDCPVRTCFLSFNISDADDGVNGEVDIEVIDGDDNTTFSVSSDGALCLNTELDREKSSDYRLTVRATDRASSVSQRLTATGHVVINVDDINDNAPSFVSASSVSIPEDTAVQTVVMVIQAVDADSGSNGYVIYTLEDTQVSLFNINSTSGHLYLRQPVDREQVDTLTVTVTATDRGSPPLASSMDITVYVEDVNDHNPEFTHSYYSLAVREDTPRGTSLLQLSALDLDIGSNGQVHYELSQDSIRGIGDAFDVRYQLSQERPFQVDSVRGIFSLMDRLDREMVSTYVLLATAVDRGHVSRSTSSVTH